MTFKAYLDNNATTAIDPRVIDAMLEEIKTFPSNPSFSLRAERSR
jgi:cysteine sulfinate desulfinase/cysteine desulfurase-like protein